MENDAELKQLEKLDLYLSDQLSEPERLALEEEMEKNENLRLELKALQLSRDAIRTSALRQQVRRLQAEYKTAQQASSSEEKEKILQKEPSFGWLKLAAVFLIGLLGYGLFELASLSTGDVYEENFISYRLPVARSTDSHFTRLDSLYLEARYAQLLSHFESLHSPSARDYFLAAISSMQEQDFDRALQLFEELRLLNSSSDEVRFAEETDYYQALAYLQTGRVHAARQLFEQIHEQPEHLFHKRVTQSEIWKLMLLQMKH
ncbi:MAG: hypothetical protein ACLFUB_20575 [Cyclobacteriaceae bacterium]